MRFMVKFGERFWVIARITVRLELGLENFKDSKKIKDLKIS